TRTSVTACNFFFFQAEDGIRAFHVTGVQTCALPISAAAWPSQQRSRRPSTSPGAGRDRGAVQRGFARYAGQPVPQCYLGAPRWRSEERRVGKESRPRWAMDHQKNEIDALEGVRNMK